MGSIIPRSLLTQAQITTKLKAMADELIELAARETNTDPSNWIVRDALPKTDFDHNKEKWENQTVFAAINTFQKDWAKELPDNKYVAFYGVVLHADNPTIYGAKFKVGLTGATTIDVIQFQKVKEEENLIGYFDRILYKKKATIYIELIADALTAAYGEEFELLCMVCEKYGEVVSTPERMTK
jgi:hypothetical protein